MRNKKPSFRTIKNKKPSVCTMGNNKSILYTTRNKNKNNKKTTCNTKLKLTHNMQQNVNKFRKKKTSLNTIKKQTLFFMNS